MNHLLLGYFLVEGHKKPEHMWPGFPEVLYTLSECICEVHPKDLLVFDGDENLRQEYCDQMAWSVHELWTIRDQLMDWQREKKYFLRAAFADLETPRAFADRWLKAKAGIKLLQAAVPEVFLDSYLGHEVFNNFGPRDVIRLHQPVEIQERFLGYDILGEDSQFHGFLCNNLVTDYSTLFQIRFNRHGLIDSLEHAIQAANYTNDLELSGADQGFWFPVAMSEVPLGGPHA